MPQKHHGAFWGHQSRARTVEPGQKSGEIFGEVTETQGTARAPEAGCDDREGAGRGVAQGTQRRGQLGFPKRGRASSLHPGGGTHRGTPLLQRLRAHASSSHTQPPCTLLHQHPELAAAAAKEQKTPKNTRWGGVREPCMQSRGSPALQKPPPIPAGLSTHPSAFTEHQKHPTSPSLLGGWCAAKPRAKTATTSPAPVSEMAAGAAP